MNATAQHVETLGAPNPVETGTKTPEQKNEEREVITNATEEATKLKEQADETAAEKIKEFISENSLDVEINVRINDMVLKPERDETRKIEEYDQAMLRLKTGIKQLLFALAKENSGRLSKVEFKQEARSFVDKSLKELLSSDTDGNNKLSYSEIFSGDIKKKAAILASIDSARFVSKMETKKTEKGEWLFDLPYNPDQKKLVTQRAEAEEKGDKAKVDQINGQIDKRKKFIRDYISELAKGLVVNGEPVEGAGLQLVNAAKTMVMETVGNQQLTNEEFYALWNELLGKDKNVEAIYAEAPEDRQTDLENLLEQKDGNIQNMQEDARERAKKVSQLKESNPHGFGLRKVGDLTSIFLYFGKDVLIATIVAAAAMSGFNPLKMIDNPVVLASVAAVLGITKYYKPDFMAGTPEAKKSEQDELKASIDKTSEPVKNWLAEFSKDDLKEKGVIGTLLKESGRTSISSKELETALKKKHKDDKEEVLIPENSSFEASTDQARKIYLLFKSCQQTEVNPSDYLNA